MVAHDSQGAHGVAIMRRPRCILSHAHPRSRGTGGALSEGAAPEQSLLSAQKGRIDPKEVP